MIRFTRLPFVLVVLGLLLAGMFRAAVAGPMVYPSRATAALVADTPFPRAQGPATRGTIKQLGVALPTSGVVKILAIPVEFVPDNNANTSGTGTFPYNTWGPASQAGYLESRLRMLAQYYAEVSGNRVALQTTLASVVRLPNNMAKYRADLGNAQEAISSSLLRDTVKLADGTTDFSLYDAVMLIHAGAGIENSLDSKNSLDLPSFAKVLGTPLLTNDPADINGYLCVPETFCNDTIFKAANQALNIQQYELDRASATPFIPHYWDVVGIWVHEVGHAFGLPDLYDTLYANGLSLGAWTPMAGGYLPERATTEPGYGAIPYDPTRPYFASSPSHLDAWSKQLLGWTSIVNVSGRRANETILPQETTTGITYRLWKNGSTTSKEYYLVENRQQLGYDRYLPAAGLIIYHIDDTIGTIAANNLQIAGTHQRIKIVTADDAYESQPSPNVANVFYLNVGASAAFPGTVNNTHFGASTVPASTSYLGSNSFVDINTIRLAGTSVIADLQTGTGSSVTFTSPLPGTTVYVTKPIIGIVSPSLDVNQLSVTLNGVTLISNTLGNVNTYYDANTGQLTVPLDGTLAGPLTVGTYRLVLNSLDTVLGGAITETLNFTVAEKMLPAEMRMISLPVTGVGTVPTVFVGQNTLELARYNPLTNSYAIYPDPFAELTTTTGAAYDRVDPTRVLAPAGKAFWVRKATATAALRLAGDLVPSDRQFVVPVLAGFNMIGNPLSFAVSFSSLLVEYDGKTYSIGEAASAGLLDPALYSWTGTAYATTLLPVGTLEPWAGYWLHCKAGTVAKPLNLIFQPISASRAPQQGPVRSRGTASNWELALQAAAGGATARVLLGVAPASTDGIDNGLDLYAPPAAPGGVGVASAATRGAGGLYRDYRQAGATVTWQLDVTAPAGSQLVLSWPDLTRLPAGTVATLRDAVTGETRYLRTAVAFPVALGAVETSRRFILTVAQETGNALRVQGLRAMRTRATGTTRISCEVSQAATLTVEIRSATGACIRRLVAGACAPGTVTLTWDGKDAQGRAVPNGTYQCQVLAVTGSGQSAKAVTLVPAL